MGERILSLPEIKAQFPNNHSVTVPQYSLYSGHVFYNVLLLLFRFVRNSITYWVVLSASPNSPADSGHRRGANKSFKLSLNGARIPWLIPDSSLVCYSAQC